MAGVVFPGAAPKICGEITPLILIEFMTRKP